MIKIKTKENAKCNLCNKDFKTNKSWVTPYDPVSKKVSYFHFECALLLDMIQTKAGLKLIDKAFDYVEKEYKLTT
jgi:hypothetical protein